MKLAACVVPIAVLAMSQVAAATEEPRLEVVEPELPCLELIAQDRFDDALAVCREELAENPHSSELTRATARAEFEAGDPERAEELWQAVLDHEGWTVDTARELAMATWRAGRPSQAEPILRQIVEQSPEQARGYRDLVNFLLSFGRVDEAEPVSAEATRRFPDDCEILEDRGVVAAEAGNDTQAAGYIARAVAAGCPPFRWVGRGALAQRHDDPAYAQLLEPTQLVVGLEQMDDAACRERLALLKPRMSVEVADAITAVVLERKTAEVRLAGLGLLASLGPQGLPWWEKIFATDDFILEKHALRRIREVADPAFIPLLEKRLDAKQTPGNRALTQLTLGELLLKGSDAARGRQLLLSIAEDSELFPVALMSLADHEEAAGSFAAALELVERAKTIDPELYVNPDRVAKLRRAVAEASPTGE